MDPGQRRSAGRRQPAVDRQRDRRARPSRPAAAGRPAATWPRALTSSSTRSPIPTIPNRSRVPSSATFVVTAGEIPQVTLPPLPAGASAYNVYLSNASAAAGSAVSYVTQVTTPLFNLAAAAPSGGIAPPTTQSPTIAPTVKPTGGSPYGGRLMAGTYFVFYTFTYPNGVETLPSAASAPFTVAAGNVPHGHAAAAARRCIGDQPLSVRRHRWVGPGRPLRNRDQDDHLHVALRRAGERDRSPGQPDRDGRRDGERDRRRNDRRQTRAGNVLRLLHLQLPGRRIPDRRRIGPQPRLAAVHGGGGRHPAGLAAAAPSRGAPVNALSATTSTCRIRRPTRTRRPATPRG